MSEGWKAIPGYEGAYEVSNHGRVRNLDRRVYAGRGRTRTARGKIRKLVANPVTGYLTVRLCVNNVAKSFNVHSLVLMAFVGPMPDGHATRHLDGNRTNNSLSNLKYGTYSENTADMARHGTMTKGESCSWAVLTDAIVREMRKMHSGGISVTQISKTFKVGRITAHYAIHRHTWAHVQ